MADTDFYLAGGTALALYIGHRPSVDFDWFITRLGEPERLFQKLRAFEVDFDVQSVALETVYLAIDAVQVSFIGYNYPLLQPPRMMGEPGVRLADPDDIACMKLSAIASRGSRKDFVDLYFMINRFRSLKDYLQLYRIKYQNRDIGHLMRSLVYFGDAEAEPEIVTAKSFDWQKMKEDFERWVRDLATRMGNSIVPAE
ncbi:MAG: hypothetical protein A2Z25_11815 [Planctomycetes bacterium RBG_16_55_9]|nr:MAG: hypothetical protein A2Z25_11815 [Planctomycetes bacterium RBG_16_55_9]